MTSGPTRRSALRWLAPAAALVLVALCLRGPFAAVGPLLDGLRAEYSVSTAALGVLTAVPLLCFALASPFAPRLAARVGVHRALVLAALAVAVGVTLRAVGTPGLFAGTVLLTSGMAVGNVLVPAAARADYAERGATVVGVTTCAVGLSAAIGAGLAQPMASLTGSARSSLLTWALLPLVAAAALAALARSRPHTAPATDPPRRAILRDRVALLVTLFFGFQSLSYYVMLSWLPDILQHSAGLSAVAAGGLLALATAMGAPLSLIVPTWAARRPGQGRWVVAAGVPMAAGLAGLLLAPDAAPVLWAVLWGMGTGTAFPLGMTLVLLRTRDVAQTGRLSAAAQSTGYLLAATGPLGAGLLHEVTGGWRVSLLVLLLLVVVQTGLGLGAARPRLVTEPVAAGAAQLDGGQRPAH